MLQNALLSVKVQNLKYFLTSLLENCFLAVTQHCSSSINPTKCPIHQAIKVQNLKSQNVLLKYFMTSLLGNCFFSRHSTAFDQYQCYKMLFLSVKVQNLKSKKVLLKYL